MNLTEISAGIISGAKRCIRYLPGYRGGNLIKAAVASFVYALVTLLCIGACNPITAVITAVVFLVPFFLITNFLNVRRFLPFLPSLRGWRLVLVVSLVFITSGIAWAILTSLDVNVEIVSPEDGATITAPNVEVIGSVTPPFARVTVAGFSLAVEGDGSFSRDISLSEGHNEISIKAGATTWRSCGRDTKKLLITRELTEEEKIARALAEEEARRRVEEEEKARIEAEKRAREETKRRQEEEERAKTLAEEEARRKEEEERQVKIRAEEEKRNSYATKYCSERSGRYSRHYALLEVVTDSEGKKGYAPNDVVKKRGTDLSISDCRKVVDFMYDWGIADIDNIIEEKFWVGMDRVELLLSVGWPNDINTSNYGFGVSEQWVYHKDAYGISSYYFYVDNNKVTSYQNW